MSSIIVIKENFDDLPRALSLINAVGKKFCIITDTNVSALYLEEVYSRVACCDNRVFSFSMEPGEDSKSLDTVNKIYDFLFENKFDRDDIIIALGGGVVGDTAGYTASTYKRGLRFIQIPTTLLAQVDSAIGGKNAVDYNGVKNLIGTFYNPSLVYINKTVLDSLPPEEVSNGKAELIKTGIISKGDFEPAIEDCVFFKKQITDEDPYDENKRMFLNFGHTFGHALESIYGYSLKHGYCVALGMICAFSVSADRGWLPDDKIGILKSVLKKNGLYVSVRLKDPEKIIEYLSDDKKIRDGRLRFVLMKGLGNPVVADDVSDKEIRHALEKINE